MCQDQRELLYDRVETHLENPGIDYLGFKPDPEVYYGPQDESVATSCSSGFGPDAMETAPGENPLSHVFLQGHKKSFIFEKGGNISFLHVFCVCYFE